MARAPKILLVDDEVSIQRAVAPLLRSRGYDVEVAGTGTEALRAWAAHRPDLIILDLGLPDLDGPEVCRRVRAESNVPVVVLSARSAEDDKLSAFDLGADDYVTKPFGPEELLARIRVALRHGEEIRLTPKEFDLLSLFARNRDRVLTHRTILTEIWGPAAVGQPEHLWVLIGQLRKREIDAANPTLLISEPWVGYRLVSD